MNELLLSPSSGLSVSNLKKATATPSDVLSGKSFYAGSDEMQFGTYSPVISSSAISSGQKTGPMTVTVSDQSIKYVIATGWLNNVAPNNRPSITGTNITLEKLYGYGINSTTTVMHIKITGYPASITMQTQNSGQQLSYAFVAIHMS